MSKVNPNLIKLQNQKNQHSVWILPEGLGQLLNEDREIRDFVRGTLLSMNYKVSDIILKRKVKTLKILFLVYRKKKKVRLYKKRRVFRFKNRRWSKRKKYLKDRNGLTYRGKKHKKINRRILFFPVRRTKTKRSAISRRIPRIVKATGGRDIRRGTLLAPRSISRNVRSGGPLKDIHPFGSTTPQQGDIYKSLKNVIKLLKTSGKRLIFRKEKALRKLLTCYLMSQRIYSATSGGHCRSFRTMSGNRREKSKSLIVRIFLRRSRQAQTSPRLRKRGWGVPQGPSIAPAGQSRRDVRAVPQSVCPSDKEKDKFNDIVSYFMDNFSTTSDPRGDDFLHATGYLEGSARGDITAPSGKEDNLKFGILKSRRAIARKSCELENGPVGRRSRGCLTQMGVRNTLRSPKGWLRWRSKYLFKMVRRANRRSEGSYIPRDRRSEGIILEQREPKLSLGQQHPGGGAMKSTLLDLPKTLPEDSASIGRGVKRGPVVNRGRRPHKFNLGHRHKIQNLAYTWFWNNWVLRKGRYDKFHKKAPKFRMADRRSEGCFLPRNYRSAKFRRHRSRTFLVNPLLAYGLVNPQVTKKRGSSLTEGSLIGGTLTEEGRRHLTIRNPIIGSVIKRIKKLRDLEEENKPLSCLQKWWSLSPSARALAGPTTNAVARRSPEKDFSIFKLKKLKLKTMMFDPQEDCRQTASTSKSSSLLDSGCPNRVYSRKRRTAANRRSEGSYIPRDSRTIRRDSRSEGIDLTSLRDGSSEKSQILHSKGSRRGIFVPRKFFKKRKKFLKTSRNAHLPSIYKKKYLRKIWWLITTQRYISRPRSIRRSPGRSSATMERHLHPDLSLRGREIVAPRGNPQLNKPHTETSSRVYRKKLQRGRKLRRRFRSINRIRSAFKKDSIQDFNNSFLVMKRTLGINFIIQKLITKLEILTQKTISFRVFRVRPGGLSANSTLLTQWIVDQIKNKKRRYQKILGKAISIHRGNRRRKKAVTNRSFELSRNFQDSDFIFWFTSRILIGGGLRSTPLSSKNHTLSPNTIYPHKPRRD